ncbi:MAG: NB-ARC domain-containing protein, partial [Bacteroidota bacterium]
METAAFLAQIRQQIEHNDIRGALTQLKKLLENSPHLTEVLQQMVRFQELSKQIRMGTIEYDNATLTINQITHSLLELIDEIESQSKKPLIAAEVQKAIQKNLVQDASLWAAGNISIGDSTIHNHYHAYPNGREIPKVLSPTNPLYPQYFIGREAEMDKIHQHLSEPGKFLLLVNGKGGIGKTSLAARYYHHSQQHYQHLAWVLKEPGKSIVDALLSLELQLGLKAEAQTPEQRLQVLLRELTNLRGPSLLVIDNADDMEDLEQHHRLVGGLTQWRIIFTTRVTELTDLPRLVINGLSEKKALELFSHYYRELDKEEDNMVREIRKAVNANTLILEILAKNLRQLNRLREYSLSKLLKKLGEGLLSIPGKTVSTPYQQLNQATPEEIIKAMYDLAPLSEHEQTWLAIFAALPADNIPYVHLDLLLDYAQDREDELLALAQKGWLDFA